MENKINWRLLSIQYMRQLDKNPIVRNLRKQQADGLFSGSPIKVNHYIDVMELIGNDSILNSYEKPMRIIDVGSYLNVFPDFINNFDKRISELFIATGIENSPVMCDISNNLFGSNRLIQGDALNLSALVDSKYDIVILNNFFHLEFPFEKQFIKKVFMEIDRIINPGGLIFYKYDNKRIYDNKEMIIVSKEGDRLTGKDLFNENYTYSNEIYNYFWYIIKRNRTISRNFTAS